MQHVQIDDAGLTILDRTPWTLAVLQAVVGGRVTHAAYWHQFSPAGGLVAYVNADWSTPGLGPTARLGAEILYGPVVLVGVDASGRDRSLTDEELARIRLEPTTDGPPRLQLDALA